MSFNALIVNKDDDGNVSQNIEQVELLSLIHISEPTRPY